MLNMNSFFSLIVFLSFSYCSLYFVLAARRATQAGIAARATGPFTL